MSTSSIVQQFVNGLKSRNRNVQNKAAQDLFLYVKTELREMSQEELVQFFEDFDHHIFNMVNAADINEKKGGALAMSTYQQEICLVYMVKIINNLFSRVSDKWRWSNYTQRHLALPQSIAWSAAHKWCVRYGNSSSLLGQACQYAGLKRRRIVWFRYQKGLWNAKWRQTRGK